jgi:hypothetical protein
VLYAGDRRACFLETLAPFRPGLLNPEEASAIPQEWFATRRIASFSLDSRRWRAVDLRSSETTQELRREFGPFLRTKGYTDFDFSHLLSRDFEVTQEISAWSFENGFSGIVYSSRFDLDQRCIAIFEGSVLSAVHATTIARDDPDLVWAAHILRLVIPA